MSKTWIGILEVCLDLQFLLISSCATYRDVHAHCSTQEKYGSTMRTVHMHVPCPQANWALPVVFSWLWKHSTFSDACSWAKLYYWSLAKTSVLFPA